MEERKSCKFSEKILNFYVEFSFLLCTEARKEQSKKRFPYGVPFNDA